MRNAGVYVCGVVLLGSLAGSAHIVEALLTFLLAGLIPGTTISINPNIMLGLAAVVASAVILQRLVEHLLFPSATLTRHTLPKKRYVKLS